MTTDDANGPLLATILGGYLATTSVDHFLEGGPISAALSGAVLAGFKAASTVTETGAKVPRYRWFMPVISGVATGIYMGPALADNLGFVTYSNRVFLFFLLGLVGSFIVDFILDNRAMITNWLLRRGCKVPLPPSPDNPAKG